MKGCINILGLTLFLIQIIIIINSKKSLASSLSLRSDKDEQRCGYESCYEKCPTGQCCSKLGYCGTTFEHCGYKYCKLQCPSPPSPPSPFPPPPGRCGVQAGGIKCPDGSCCGEEDDYECGHQGCYKKCPSGSCCSMWGYCGTTKGHCGKPRCQSQCPPPPPPPPPPPYAIGRCGMQAGGRKCPTGLCCSSSGWCGTTKYYCAKQWCQSQCNTITSSTMSGTETFLLDGIV
ncbi:chitin-binding lectin 1-like isoform X2 [Solanum tuberosum]|uniref:chitin-binding lectin 1-like isoform X2 n=1 Tax=Solanum tuberosum TaxID=4113 RepID=UPI00073A1DEC|nr:PREDICTED: chitin-binding lectin 1-like isoform X2 [Solanum tuberosum]